MRIVLLAVLAPVLLFSQNAILHSIQVMGGSRLDTVTSITPDTSGNIYVLGTTQSPDFPATATFGPAVPSRFGDTFVAKIRVADWSLVWSTVIRPSLPLGMAVGKDGSVYVTGHTASPSDFPATPGAFRVPATGAVDTLFVVKLDASGTRLAYAAFLSPYGTNSNSAIAVDDQGEAYVTGEGIAPVTAGAFIRSPLQGTFLAKLNANGSSLIFCTYISKNTGTSATALAVDSRQSVFIVGGDTKFNTSFPSTPGTVQPNHAAFTNAFVMKLKSDGSGIEFATLLGGSGADYASFIALGDEGSIYIAGTSHLDTSPGSIPFPVTGNAPFQQAGDGAGFVARLNSTATLLLFSTFLGNASSASPAGLVVSSGRVYVPYRDQLQSGFAGLNYYPQADIKSTSVLILDTGGGLTGPPLKLPAIAPDAFAVFGDSLIVAASASQIDLPLPSTIQPIGPLGRDPAVARLSQADVTFGRFLMNGSADHAIDADAGYLVFEGLPATSPGSLSVNITSTGGPAPFHVFAPSPTICCSAAIQYSVTPSEGIAPATITVLSSSFSPTDPSALLIVSPLSSQSIQALPLFTYRLFPELVVTGPDALVLPPDGGSAQGTIQLRGLADSIVYGRTIDVSLPFQFNSGSVPPFIGLDSLQGTTPASVQVVGQLDSLKPGASDAELLTVTSNGATQRVLVVLQRLGPPPLVDPASLRIAGALGSSSRTATLQLNPPAGAGFQVVSIPDRVRVDPSSGNGPQRLTVTADLTRYPTGTTSEKLVIQFQDSTVTVNLSVRVSVNPMAIYNGLSQGPVSPGLRATIALQGSLAGLPGTGSWSEASPAPTDWNSYYFTYRSRKLPILSANADTLDFDVQFPYDLDLTGNHAPLDFRSADGTVLATTPTFGVEASTSLAPQAIGYVQVVPVKPDGSVVTADNPVRPGDTIRISVLGAGVTQPYIAAGLLPPDATAISPTAEIRAVIGGKSAAIARQALSSSYIGITDLDISIPILAPGQQMLGLTSGASHTVLIPIWVAK